MKFGELGLSNSLLKAIKRSGYEEATPIQEQTIPMVLNGDDVIGQAQTGTGKTAAFGLPILEHIDPQNPAIQALIISPIGDPDARRAVSAGKRQAGQGSGRLWWS